MAKKRTKKVTHKGVTVEISFQCGELNYDVKNGAESAKANDLHEALGTARVEQRTTNFLIRGVKQSLGL